MGEINRRWHEQHRMPKNPTARQRIDWHMAHAANCSCRPIPAGVLALMNGEARARPVGQRTASRVASVKTTAR